MAYLANVQIYLLVGFQTAYFIAMVSIRPFNRAKVNVLLVLSEAYLLVISLVILYCNRQERWTSLVESVCIYFLASFSILAAVVVVSKFELTSVQRLES